MATFPRKEWRAIARFAAVRGTSCTFVPTAVAKIDAADGQLVDYTFNKHMIHHHFCLTCGCSPFGRGSDDKGNEMVAINLRCVPELGIETLKINQFDGASK